MVTNKLPTMSSEVIKKMKCKEFKIFGKGRAICLVSQYLLLGIFAQFLKNMIPTYHHLYVVKRLISIVHKTFSNQMSIFI